MKKTILGLGFTAAFCFAASAQASFLIDIDTDGLDDGPWTPHANFSFGGDTTTASTSIKATGVAGLAGADSLFGGDASLGPDTYQVTYNPGLDGDNANLTGVSLNSEGDIGGPLAGATGDYNIYATWPATNNVNTANNGLVNFTVDDGVGTVFTVQLSQNTVQDDDGDGFGGNEWIYLGTATLDASTTYTLKQEATGNSFVSMRAAGYLFDAVPEPASLGLMGLGGLAMLSRQRR